jgi:hypothetical protein
MSRKSTTMDSIEKKEQTKYEKRERKDRKTTRKISSCTCYCRSCFCYFLSRHVEKYLIKKKYVRKKIDKRCIYMSLLAYFFPITLSCYRDELYAMLLSHSLDKNNSSNQIAMILFFHILDTSTLSFVTFYIFFLW